MKRSKQKTKDKRTQDRKETRRPVVSKFARKQRKKQAGYADIGFMNRVSTIIIIVCLVWLAVNFLRILG